MKAWEEPMFRDPALESAGVAAYQWGSFLLETNALFQADGKTIVRTYAGASMGKLPFDSSMEMRTALAVLHELVHLKQDLGTGLGAYDHLVTRKASLNLVGQTKWFVTKLDDSPYRKGILQRLAELDDSDFTMEFRRDLDVLENHTVAWRQLRGHSWITPDVRNALNGAIGTEIPEEDLTMYSLRRLFESEAASDTFGLVSTSGVSRDGRDLLESEEFKKLWDPSNMGEEYFSTIVDIARSMDRDVDAEELAEGLLAYAALAEFAADFASAYPPPSMLSTWKHSKHLFEPVVRFLLFLRALVTMPAATAEQMMMALLEQRCADAEAALAQYISVPYPSMTSIYREWVSVLEPLAAGSEWDAPLFGLRLSMVRSRLDSDTYKALRMVFDAEAPIQVLVQNTGIRGLLWGQHFTDDKLKEALLLKNVDRELLELFYGTSTYRCPYGRAGICAGRTPKCSAGLTHVAQFPSQDVCSVRRNLQELGYYI
jgi:hypothetical protein